MGRLLHYLTRRAPAPAPVDEDRDGLALHLAELAGEDWRALTPARLAQLRALADIARAAAVEGRRHAS